MVYVFHVFSLEMEKLETSELQSRLSSLSVSSFPGITSNNCEENPLNRFVQFFFQSSTVVILDLFYRYVNLFSLSFWRLQSTDLSRTLIQPDNQTKMDDNSNNRESVKSTEVQWIQACLMFVYKWAVALCLYVCFVMLSIGAQHISGEGRGGWLTGEQYFTLRGEKRLVNLLLERWS